MRFSRNFQYINFTVQDKQVDLLPKMKENVSTPEGVPRLFNLVKVQDERMKLAFFAALGNTVVAEDLDQVGYRIDAWLMAYVVIYAWLQGNKLA